jgi:hypothetical protein
MFRARHKLSRHRISYSQATALGQMLPLRPHANHRLAACGLALPSTLPIRSLRSQASARSTCICFGAPRHPVAQRRSLPPRSSKAFSCNPKLDTSRQLASCACLSASQALTWLPSLVTGLNKHSPAPALALLLRRPAALLQASAPKTLETSGNLWKLNIRVLS